MLAPAGLNLKVEEARRVDATVAGRHDRQPGSAAGRADAARAQRQGVDQRGSARDLGAGAARRVRADGAAARAAGRPAARVDRRDPLGGLHRRNRRRAEPAAAEGDAQRRTGDAARQPRRARRDLRDARPDRRQRRSRRGPAALARLPRLGRRRSSVSRACRPASSCGRARRAASSSAAAIRSRSR